MINLNDYCKNMQSDMITHINKKAKLPILKKNIVKEVLPKYENLEYLENWMEDTRHNAKVIFSILGKKEKLSILDNMAVDFCKKILGGEHE